MRLLPIFAVLSSLAGLSTAAAAADEQPVDRGSFTAPGYVSPSRSSTAGNTANPNANGANATDGTGSGTGSGTGTIGQSAVTLRPGSATDRAGDRTTDRDADRGNADRRSGRNGVEAPERGYQPPPQPSEFQKFVETATGRLLPVFGSRFFADAAGGQNALENVPVSADYVVGPGDELVIRAWGSIDVDYRTTVDRNGLVNLPKVGSFSVAGVKAADLERQLRAQIGRLYTNFTLNVTLGQLRGVRIFVVGPAQRPGVYTLPSQSTLLSAVLAAGGPAPNGSMRHLSLRRNGALLSEMDVYEFLVQGDKSKDVQLAAGDVVVFQPAGPRVAITGATETPAIFELRSVEEPLREVLRYAGGPSVLANPNNAQLERIDAARLPASRFVEQFKLDGTGLQKPLRGGDVLTLLAISPQFGNAVTLKGHVAQPLRYPYTPGMRIRDLIPDKEALISADFYRRKNVLVQMLDAEALDDARRALTTTTVTPTEGGPSVRRDVTRDTDRVATARAQRPTPVVLFDELNWQYAVIERLNERDLSTQLIAFDLGRAVLQRDESQNLELKPGDVVTIYGQKDVRVPVSRQTRLVTLDGEVSAPGVYQLQPGETLRQLLARAGGFTPQAYVYGLEFTREETRVRQRENLLTAIARLESLSATQVARQVANRSDDASSERAAAAGNAATQEQIGRLRRLQPNGRIALELNPADATIAALPDLPLDAGDRISVPPRPGFVTVAGAVVNNNAFLWKAGRSAGDYLRLAGLEEAADTSNLFVLRADGTVAHARDNRGVFGYRGVDSQALQPGDTVVVPTQLDFETFGRALIRNLKDFSQIFAQFGLGAAAIQTLRN